MRFQATAHSKASRCSCAQQMQMIENLKRAVSTLLKKYMFEYASILHIYFFKHAAYAACFLSFALDGFCNKKTLSSL